MNMEVCEGNGNGIDHCNSGLSESSLNPACSYVFHSCLSPCWMCSDFLQDKRPMNMEVCHGNGKGGLSWKWEWRSVMEIEMESITAILV